MKPEKNSQEKDKCSEELSEKFKEWLKNHYSDLHFEAYSGQTNSILFDALFARKNIFLVPLCCTVVSTAKKRKGKEKKNLISNVHKHNNWMYAFFL